MKKALGWLFLVVLSGIISFWAFWGIVESFYEGWYNKSFFANLWLTISRYLLPVWILLLPSIFAVYYKKLGAIVFAALGISISLYFTQWFFFIPLFVIASLSWFSQLPSKKLCVLVILAAPLITLVISGFQPAYRVATRFDGDISKPFKTMTNGQQLTWAPPGPGWSSTPSNWTEAVELCEHLSSDGKTITDTLVGLWRLPTIEEIVASTYFHGKPMPGTWSKETLKTYFEFTPDKEPPMWNPHSPIIYWWTSNTAGDSALMYSFNGVVFNQEKQHKAGYYGFRAVRLER